MDKKEYKENNDVLITHGKEALTFRKDDPRTKKYIDKTKKENLEKLKKDGSDDLWAGISLSNKRQDGETFAAYKDRRATINQLEKVYKMLGRDECKKQYPNGFAYALYLAMGNDKKEYGNFINKEIKDLKQPPMTATITNEDGTTREVKVITNNDKK
tara:strand:+ start:42 stop:512 length:471 start_codon:yes stop_codon:yes gene_type:complete